MIPEAPFFLSSGAVGMSLASLAGLVVAFRRGDAWAAHDLYRLRQIVEFGFSAALLGLAAIAAAASAGTETGLRLAALAAFSYLIGSFLVLLRRRSLAGVPISPAVYVVDLTCVVAATTAIVLATPASYEWLLLALICRPMLAFLLFLSTLETS